MDSITKGLIRDKNNETEPSYKIQTYNTVVLIQIKENRGIRTKAINTMTFRLTSGPAEVIFKTDLT